MNMGAVMEVIEGRQSRGRVIWRLRRSELIYPTMHCPATQAMAGWSGFWRSARD